MLNGFELPTFSVACIPRILCFFNEIDVILACRLCPISYRVNGTPLGYTDMQQGIAADC